MARGFDLIQIADMYSYGFSLPEIERATGISRSTVRNWMLGLDLLRGRTEAVIRAAGEGRLGSGLRGKTREFSAQHKEAIRKHRLAHGELNAKGVTLKKNGYLAYTRGPHKGRHVHRVLGEQLAGRPLDSTEHVHHADEVKTNNDPGNLEILPANEHCSLHSKENAKHRERNPNGTWR